ncbi:hypothetical protein CYLTODRAFT_422945 [Cylindrobasidium torrendii FP15055 ss-10]|uniref:Uncharacterized protein n=1 Tax=Cylindrobasidium torrendii FP15055 ss-10 TaxID=1314674 RepID=A0A0D7B931_9AGAR|nr:hypothetical protein CYLTODRAFT_422945 [Cylindrobasidium torrendii FP15055 ss-10]
MPMMCGRSRRRAICIVVIEATHLAICSLLVTTDFDSRKGAALSKQMPRSIAMRRGPGS